MDPRWVVPVPVELATMAARHPLVVTVEDNSWVGGVGARVSSGGGSIVESWVAAGGPVSG
jgi:deoxyxylulose-5-phosphate synthase